MKAKYYLNYIMALFSGLLLFSCEGEKEPNVDLGYDYYKVSLGQINIYAVDTIYHSALLNNSDTVKCFIKEIISENILDSSGSRTYKVDAYLSYDTSKGWKWYDYYFYRTDTNSVRRIVGNTSSLIFVYPVVKNKKWNVNLFNNNSEEFAYFRKVNFKYESYLDCAEILFKEDINFIEERVLRDVYAKNIGLVFRYFSDVSINNSIKDGIEVNLRRM